MKTAYTLPAALALVLAARLSGAEPAQLTIPWPEARVVPLVADAPTPDLRGSTASAVAGRLRVDIGDAPVLVLHPSDRLAAPPDACDYPLGIHGIEGDYADNLRAMEELGARWARLAAMSGVVWDFVEPPGAAPNWRHHDQLYRDFTRMGVRTMVTISTTRWDGRPRDRFPEDAAAYLDFLRRTVERYDGDGIQDAPDSPVVSCWQFGNEIDDPRSWHDSRPNYVRLLQTVYPVVKAASPRALVAFSGMATPAGVRQLLIPMLNEMAKSGAPTCFDVVDLHWSRQFPGTYDRLDIGGTFYGLGESLVELRAALDRCGYARASIWITEMSDYSGSPLADPFLGSYPARSEREQASSLCKMATLALASGAERVFWVTLKEWHGWGGLPAGSYFDCVGLVRNPANQGRSGRKPAFDTLSLLGRALSGFRPGDATALDLPAPLRGFRFTRGDRTRFVLWRDAAGAIPGKRAAP